MPWEQPGMTAEERAEAIADHFREEHEANSSPYLGCAGFPYIADALTSALRSAVAQEREACAQVCETVRANDHVPSTDWSEAATCCAELIRLRGEEGRGM